PESFTDGLLPVPATDIYGLAATLWAILAGHAPFKDPGERPAPVTVFGRVAMHQVGDLRDRVPSPICRFIERSMAKRPERRPASMADFLTELQAAREDAYRGVEVERLEVEPLLVSTRPEGDDPASNDPAGAAGDGFSGGGEESPASAHQDVDLTDAGSAQRNPAGGQSTVDPLAVETVPVVDVEGDEEETLAPGEPVDTWLVPAADDEVTITPEEREADGSDSSTETIEAEAETSDTDIDIDGDPGADTDIDIEGDPGIDRHGGGAGDRVGRDPVDVDGPADDAGDVDPVSNGYADLVRLGFLGDDDPAASETRLGRPVPVVFPGELTEPALKGTETDDSSDAAVVGPTGDGDVSTGSDWLGKVLVAAIVTLVLLLTAWWLFGLGSGAESGESDSALVVVDAGSTVAVAPLS
ncbi:MAG: hypothetical protein OER95_01120, partial [Acidimicrobiia bacterium]|nr:hypothetical protein [Acidimicrobiia bacterium]